MLTSVKALLLWGLVGGWLSSQTLKHMVRHCAMRMVQTCAASMMYKAQAEGILGRLVPSTLCTPAVTQLTDAAAGWGASAGAAVHATECQRCMHQANATAGLWGAGVKQSAVAGLWGAG